MFLKSSVISPEVAKTLYKKTVQENMHNDRLNEQYFSRAHTVERRE